jgi:acyl-CoA thioester hydrolase
MIKTELKYRVLYAHTDKMGIVYYGKYYEYFEAGRNDMLRKIGYPYRNLENKNYLLPVIESSAKYYSSAKYDDEISVITMMKQMPTVRFRIEYEIYNENDLIVTGHTVHSFVNSLKMKPVKPPDDFIELLKKHF